MDGNITQATLGTGHRTQNNYKNTLHKGWTRYFQKICSSCFCKTIISFFFLLLLSDKNVYWTRLCCIYIYIFLKINEKQKYSTLSEQFLISKIKIVERGKLDTPISLIHERSLSSLGTLQYRVAGLD